MADRFSLGSNTPLLSGSVLGSNPLTSQLTGGPGSGSRSH